MLLLVASAVPATAAAQGAIRGLVFDSLLGVPLGGVQVWLRGTERRTVTDPVGRFRIDTVAAGRYVVAVAHGGLDSAGLYNLAAPVAVAAGETASVTLATPSLATVWQRGCRAELGARTDSGVVFGFIQDAATGARLAGAGVIASWIRLVQPARNQVRVDNHDLRVRTDSVGGYYACGVASNMIVRVRAYAATDSTGLVNVRVGPRAVARQDLLIALPPPSGAERSPARLRGTVMTPEGKPLEGARVDVRDAASTVTARDGTFLLAGVPAGTQWLSVQTVGRVPVEQTVDLRSGETAVLSVTASPLPLTLDPVLVTAARQSRAMADVEERRRAGWGHVRTEAELERMGSMRAVFTSIPSVRFARTSSVRDVAVLLPNYSAGGGAYCLAPLFIDGFRADYEELSAYRPADLLAVEVYPRPTGVPVRFQAVASRCGVVLVWTKYVR